MDLEKDALEYIFSQLKAKASLKQLVYRNLMEVFSVMKEECHRIALDLEKRIVEFDSSVSVEYHDTSEFEFRLKFGGDTLVFHMQSNIITFKDDFPLIQTPYIAEETNRKYFGHITIYNFLSDSIKYHRLQDPGYLIARILLNKEKHFFVEGVGQLNFLFQDLENNVATADWLRLIIEKAMAETIDRDLIGPKFPEIKSINLKQKVSENLAAIRGQKIGFPIASNEDLED